MAALFDFLKNGIAAALIRAVPTTFTSNTLCHSASSPAVTSPTAPIPALLIKISKPFLATSATDLFTSSLFVMSQIR